MYKFDSDYLEGCLPQILQALEDTNLEQTSGYGLDPHCERAADLIRKACGAPSADVHFLVGGTQTNVTVIASLLRPYQGVLCAESGHINVHETGAVEHSGHKVIALPSEDGTITAAQISRAVIDHYADESHEHISQPAMVYISFPTEKGTIYSLDELESISDVCHKHHIPLFVDGARLGYGLACDSCDVTLKDIASLADVFYIGGTKQGALFGEAVVFTDPGLSRDFRYNIKQNGGMLAKGRLLGIQFETLFTDGLYLKAARNAIDRAMEVRSAFKARGVDFFVESPTNQQFPVLPDKAVEYLRRSFSFETWARVSPGMTAVRFCTSWATPAEAVAALADAVAEMPL